MKIFLEIYKSRKSKLSNLNFTIIDNISPLVLVISTLFLVCYLRPNKNSEIFMSASETESLLSELWLKVFFISCSRRKFCSFWNVYFRISKTIEKRCVEWCFLIGHLWIYKIEHLLERSLFLNKYNLVKLIIWSVIICIVITFRRIITND